MLTFKSLTLDDISSLTRYLPLYGSGDCNLSIAALYSRRQQKNIFWCEADSHLIIKWTTGECKLPSFVFPLGIAPSRSLFEKLEEVAVADDLPLRIYGNTDTILPALQTIFPEREMTLRTTPDRWDFVYRREDFVNLAGPAFHSKRNFVKRFWKNCPEARFTPFSKERIGDFHQFLENWYAERDPDPELLLEAQVIDDALSHYEALQITGGFLECGNRILGFSYGAMADKDTFAVHIEKARRDIPGAYPALAQALAQILPDSVTYLNREEDLGIPGLRKAKNDWHPVYQIKKGVVTLL